jgi:uncharacterized membrane protein YfcA
VIFFFSFGYRLFGRRKDWIGVWGSPLFGLLIGLTGVLVTNALITFVIPSAYRGLVVAATLTTALISLLIQRPKFYLARVPDLAFWVPFVTHFYILSAGLISGAILNPPFLFLVGLVMTIAAIYLHRTTIRHILSFLKKEDSPESV